MTLPRREDFAPDRLFPADSTDAEDTLSDSGVRARTTYRRGGEVVGTITWDDDGLQPAIGNSLRGDPPRGWRMEYDESGALSFVEPIVDGRVHGWTAQWAEDGTLLSTCRFERGTGTDLFCCRVTGRLAEAHPSRDGLPHGWEQWWADEARLFGETHWVVGKRHGPARQWTDDQLDEGYPQLFVDGVLVDRQTYLAAAQADPTLPPLRTADDRPQRALPGGFTRRVFRPAPWEEE